MSNYYMPDTSRRLRIPMISVWVPWLPLTLCVYTCVLSQALIPQTYIYNSQLETQAPPHTHEGRNFTVGARTG